MLGTSDSVTASERWVPLVQDDEVGAMAKVTDALHDLDWDARRRVLQWASGRFAGGDYVDTIMSAFELVMEDLKTQREALARVRQESDALLLIDEQEVAKDKAWLSPFCRNEAHHRCRTMKRKCGCECHNEMKS